MHLADIYLKCVAVTFIPLAVVNIYRNGIQGMGYGLLPMLAGVAELIGRGSVALISASAEVYRNMHGQPRCLDFGRRAFF